MTGKGMWAELSLFSSKSCSEMLQGSADDWDGYETFHPETEVCAARVVRPVLEELQVVRLPSSLASLEQQGKVIKVDRPQLNKLPNILGGRDGCQGDSGGPLWRWRDGCGGKKRAVQIGIISRGQKCARINRPGQYSLALCLSTILTVIYYQGIYTKVTGFKKWIQENSKDGGKVHFV